MRAPARSAWRPGEAVEADIVARYQAGERLTDIGRRYNRDHSTMRRVLQKHNVTLRPTAKRPARVTISNEELADLARSGVSIIDLARRFGVTRQAIEMRLKRVGVNDLLERRREHIIEEFEFLCGTDSFENLCRRTRYSERQVLGACEAADRLDLWQRLQRTRITDYKESYDAYAN